MPRSLLALLAAVLLGGLTTSATVLVPTEFREVVASATVIVRGRVTDVRAVSVPGGHIDTVATVAIDSSIKGDAAGFVSVRVPGGTIGRSRWVTVGAPTFAVGDQAVFFLKRGTDGVLRPVGLSMGVYRLLAEARTGRAVVAPPAVVGSTALPGPVALGDPRRRPMPVLEFESLVKMVMAAQGGPSKMDRR